MATKSLLGASADSNVHQSKSLQVRLDTAAARKLNQRCVECSSPGPTWALILEPHVTNGKPLAGLCCSICYERIAQLGEDVCELKSVKEVDKCKLSYS